MSFLVHEQTTPVHPNDDPAVLAKGREVEAARMALSAIEQRARQLECDRQSADELQALLDAQELSNLRTQYLARKADVLAKQREYDHAFQKASVPWKHYWYEHYRAAAHRFLEFLEMDALRANDEMLEAQQQAAEAGVCVEPLHVPQLTRDAIEHRCRVGRQGLGPS